MTTIQNKALKAREELISIFKNEGFNVVESPNESINGEIKQSIEWSVIPDSNNFEGYIIERQYRLDITKFSHATPMFQTYMLVYHLGIFKTDQQSNNLTGKGFKAEWKQFKLEQKKYRYKQAWSFALEWMQDAGFNNDVLSTSENDFLSKELERAKEITKPRSFLKKALNESSKLLKTFMKAAVFVYVLSTILWVLVANQVPPFNFNMAHEDITKTLQEPGMFTSFILLSSFVAMTIICYKFALRNSVSSMNGVLIKEHNSFVIR